MTDSPAVRSDLDLAEDISSVIRSYPPLRQSREFIHYDVQNGFVKVKGNVKTRQAKRHLLDHLKKLEGVGDVDSSAFLADDEISLQVGQLLPQGVMANVSMGVVVLSGELPSSVPLESFVEKIRALPGVLRVGADVSILESEAHTPAAV